MKLQDEAFEEAKRLATKGEDFSVLAGVINPEQRMRLRAFIYNLPEDVARKTIYGRVALSQQTAPSKSRGRPRKK